MSKRLKNGAGGRWYIPLGAYHAFLTYLRSDPNIQVDGIGLNELTIASLGRARLEKGYPEPSALIAKGVPTALAHSLAPFQCGGVDFILDKKGRALVADGKLIRKASYNRSCS